MADYGTIEAAYVVGCALEEKCGGEEEAVGVDEVEWREYEEGQ